MPTPSVLIDFAALALLGLIAFVSFPFAPELSHWLVWGGLFVGAYLLAYWGTVALQARRDQRRPADGERGIG